MDSIRGRLNAFWETGTEGIYWSLINPSLPSYDGLTSLSNGDRLRIIGSQDETLWDGVINLEYERNWEVYPDNPRYGQQTVLDRWVHGLQADLDPEVWANFFFARNRAVLDPANLRQQRIVPHPFVGPSAGMEARLRAVTDPETLFHDALYPWLAFYSNGSYFSLAQDWGLTLNETCQLIGNPTDEQIVAWKGVKRYKDTLMPFDWDNFVRIALLFGVYGGLDWKFHDKAEVAIWMNESSRSPKELLLSGTAGIVQIRDMLNR